MLKDIIDFSIFTPCKGIISKKARSFIGWVIGPQLMPFSLD
jgi:hypothetical protein